MGELSLAEVAGLCYVGLYCFYRSAGGNELVVSAVGQAQDGLCRGGLSALGGMVEGLQGTRGFLKLYVSFCVSVCS